MTCIRPPVDWSSAPSEQQLSRDTVLDPFGGSGTTIACEKTELPDYSNSNRTIAMAWFKGMQTAQAIPGFSAEMGARLTKSRNRALDRWTERR